MFLKSLTILLLVGGILGGSAYFLHELYYKDKKLDVIEETATPTPTPEPTPDPSIAAFEAMKPALAQNTIQASAPSSTMASKLKGFKLEASEEDED